MEMIRKSLCLHVARLRRLTLWACCVTVTAAGSSAFGADPYFTRTTQQTSQHTHVEEYYDASGDAVHACIAFAAALGFESGYCHGGGTTISLVEAGWLCSYGPGPGACNIVLRPDLHFYLYDGYYCPVGQRYVPAVNKCASWNDRLHDKPQVCTPHYGRPIYPLTASKRVVVNLGNWFGAAVRLNYDTRRKVPGNDASLTFQPKALPSFGELWETSLHKQLIFQGGSQQTIQATRGAGVWVSFTKDASGNYAPDADINDRISTVTGGGWRYYDAATQVEETYTSGGFLAAINAADGTSLNFTYTGSLLTKAQDQFARSAQFAYETPANSGFSPRIKRITDPNGQFIDFAYDSAGNLQQITWPDTSTRQFLYENMNFPWALTGVVDENQARTATYGYDAQGRANDTQAAGGADHYSASWGTPPSWQVIESYDVAADVIWRDHYWVTPQSTVVTLSNGQSTSLGASNVLGMSRMSSQSQPAGSGCMASTSAQSYDANGNLTQRDDFNGTRTCYANDPSRNLETARVDGLATTQDCASITPANATLPANSRKVSTQWHPDWRLRVRVAEPGKITTSIYNGQPDPLSVNAIASCAPSTALLPDGKPIAVLCKQVEQATTDTDGHLGFSAGLQSTVANRQTSWTYNQYGQVLTEDGPRTDINDITTYTYYSDTTTDHTMGDLQSVTNAAGKVTSYSKYNRHGQLLESTDPNGVLTVNTYDLRQRLLSSTVGGQTTSYSYDPAGQLKKVTLPDASWIGYDYDDAHRQVAVYDHKGNRTEYQLDNAGNRTGETTKDPNGALKRQLSRSIDALGRVQQTTGRE